MSKLHPEVVESAPAARQAVQARSRPVLATDPKGHVVVCCASTARRHGWTYTRVAPVQSMRAAVEDPAVPEVLALLARDRRAQVREFALQLIGLLRRV